MDALHVESASSVSPATTSAARMNLLLDALAKLCTAPSVFQKAVPALLARVREVGGALFAQQQQQGLASGPAPPTFAASVLQRLAQIVKAGQEHKDNMDRLLGHAEGDWNRLPSFDANTEEARPFLRLLVDSLVSSSTHGPGSTRSYCTVISD
jgi:hypothetical protein